MIVIEGIKLDDIAVEALVDLRNAQPPRDRLKYFDVAVESIIRPETKVKLVQKLYDDLMSHGANLDYGNIPDSKGDFTRYKYYKQIADLIEKMGLVIGSSTFEEFTLTESLFNMLISCRSDFEYGFKFDIELIKTCYCTLIIALHHMCDICMYKYIAQLKQKTGLKFPKSSSACNNLLIVKSVKGIVNSYNKGEWTQMINSFKKGRNNWLGAIGAASKALGLTAMTPAGVVVTSAGVAVGTILAILILLLMMRKLIYVFYYSAYKIEDSVRRSRTFLEFTMKNSANQSPEAIIKQNNILSTMNRIEDVIETKIFTEDKKAKKAMKIADKERFNLNEIRPDNLNKAVVADFSSEFASPEEPQISPHDFTMNTPVTVAPEPIAPAPTPAPAPAPVYTPPTPPAPAPSAPAPSFDSGNDISFF